MNILSNPRTSPAWTIALSVLLVGAGATLSATRIQTVMAESRSNAIAQDRANKCRILPSGERVTLGAYYFQPTQATEDGFTGSLLPEGTLICDVYGSSARIERGGYALYVVTATDPAAINKILTKRLENGSSPDSAPNSQVRRAVNLGVHQPNAQSPTNQSFTLQQEN